MEIIILKVIKDVLIGFLCFFIIILNCELKREQTEEFERPNTYQTAEIYFENQNAGFKLAGTLTYHKKCGQFPAAILISGREVLFHTKFRNFLKFYFGTTVHLFSIDFLL